MSNEFNKIIDFQKELVETLQKSKLTPNEVEQLIENKKPYDTIVGILENNAKLDKIKNKIDSEVIEKLNNFKGSKADDAFYDIDKSISDLMVEIDNVKHYNDKEIKKRRKEFIKQLEDCAESYEKKCDAAPPLPKEEQNEINSILDEKNSILSGINYDLAKCCKTENQYTKVDNDLAFLFKVVNNIDTKYDEEMGRKKKDISNKIQDSMYLLIKKKKEVVVDYQEDGDIEEINSDNAMPMVTNKNQDHNSQSLNSDQKQDEIENKTEENNATKCHFNKQLSKNNPLAPIAKKKRDEINKDKKGIDKIDQDNAHNTEFCNLKNEQSGSSTLSNPNATI